MSKRLIRDYYRVSLPGDLSDSVDDLAEHAINEARDRARLYCVPAQWTATLISGEIGDHEVTFRVCRIRHHASK